MDRVPDGCHLREIGAVGLDIVDEVLAADPMSFENLPFNEIEGRARICLDRRSPELEIDLYELIFPDRGAGRAGGVP
jgi:hypothetical protein